jgi:hypothetical protein
MLKSLHQMEIDIFKVQWRPCRVFQETISDYYLSGKPRFEWESMRQLWLVRGAGRFAQVCGPCPLCITPVPEGCKAKMEGLSTFLKVVESIAPGALFLRYGYDSIVFDFEATQDLWDDLLDIRHVMESTRWPIAHAFNDGEPSYIVRADGRISYVCYEWEGLEEDTYIYGNEGYVLSLTKSGINVKENFGNVFPDSYRRLYREGYSVYGENEEGKLTSFPPVKGKIPEWDAEASRRGGELVFLEPPLRDVYKDILGTLADYMKAALAAETGICVRAL